MAKIIDIKSKDKIEQKEELAMINDWGIFCDRHLGEIFCCIYWNKDKGLSFIAPTQTIMVALVTAAHKTLVKKGLIDESRKTNTSVFYELFSKLRNLCGAKSLEQ